MQRLNQISLVSRVKPEAVQSDAVSKYTYDRAAIRAGIVHFGVGNFHRCHQAVYVDKLLCSGSQDWGIVGVSMRSEVLRDKLAPQDFLYTQVTLGEDVELSVIGSILNVLVAPESPAAVIDQVADPAIKLVTITITEKGYCLCSGQIDSAHPDIVADYSSLNSPRTIYGYLAAALIQRYRQSSRVENRMAALSILCCDNIEGGGEHLQQGVKMLLEKHNGDSLHWTKNQVSFASSMVDRVSPATDQGLRRLVRTTLSLDDAWPVAAEPFSQWVIEDNFAGPRPALDTVGAVFTADISVYEQMKLRFLNAGHSIIAVLGYLSSQITVHQSLEESGILAFTQAALRENVLPVATLPPDCNGEAYIHQVMQRFRNAALPYQVQQVNSDSSQKIQQRWFPSIDDLLADDGDAELMAFALAAWVSYVRLALKAGELNDPLHDEFAAADGCGSGLVRRYLIIAGAERFDFLHCAPFMASVLKDYKMLQCTEINVALSQLLSRREEAWHA